MTITEFAPAKINLALHVLGRRADGYHELDSVVAFASVGDVLELSLASASSLQVNGPFAADVPVTTDNLVLKAHAALAAVFQVPPIAMRLTKNLPVASGIGGGSADAAAALRGILRLTENQLDTQTLQRIALSLGADVPVCLHGKACRMRGVGEDISAIPHLPSKAILLVNPMKACGTADVFRHMGLKAGDRLGTELDVDAPGSWRNDMSTAAVTAVPEIAEVLATLQTFAAKATVRMSGSGATCFALFETLDAAQLAHRDISHNQPTWWSAPALLS